MPRRLALLTLLSLAACNSTDTNDNPMCGPSAPCPSGFTCSADGVCVREVGNGKAQPLTVAVAGPGTVSVAGRDSCSATCDYTLDPGASVTLEARPGSNARFLRWTGDCTGASPSTTV